MDRYVGSGFSSDEEVSVEFPSGEQHRKKHRHRHHRRHSHQSHHSSQSDSSRDPSQQGSKERKKEPDKQKTAYADDEEEDDEISPRLNRNDSDCDQSKDLKSKVNHKKSQIFARITDQEKLRKMKNDDDRLGSLHDSSQEIDQEWKDEEFSDQRYVVSLAVHCFSLDSKFLLHLVFIGAETAVFPVKGIINAAKIV